MDKKNRHKFKRHFKEKDSQKVGCNIAPKTNDDERKVPPLKIKPLFMKPVEKKSCEPPTLDTPESRSKETPLLSKDVIEVIHSKALTVAVERMEPHIVKKYMNKFTEAATKSTPAEKSEINLKKSSDGQVSQPPNQPVGKLVLKIRTEKKPVIEKGPVWKPLSRVSDDEISLKTEKLSKQSITDKKATEPTIPIVRAEEHMKSTEPKVIYEPRKFVVPPLEPPMIVKNPPFFARKSAPKPIEFPESKTVNQKSKLKLSNEERRIAENSVERGAPFFGKHPDQFKSTDDVPYKDMVVGFDQSQPALKISNESHVLNETVPLKPLSEVQSSEKSYGMDVLSEIPTVEKVLDEVSNDEFEAKEKDGNATEQDMTENEDWGEPELLSQISEADDEHALPILGNNLSSDSASSDSFFNFLQTMDATSEDAAFETNLSHANEVHVDRDHEMAQTSGEKLMTEKESATDSGRTETTFLDPLVQDPEIDLQQSATKSEQFDLKTLEEVSDIHQSQTNAETSMPVTELSVEIRDRTLSVDHHVDSIEGESKPADEQSGPEILAPSAQLSEQLPKETLLAPNQEATIEHPRPDAEEGLLEMELETSVTKEQTEEETKKVEQSGEAAKTTGQSLIESPISDQDLMAASKSEMEETEAMEEEEIYSDAKTEGSKFDNLEESIEQPNLHQSTDVIEGTHSESSNSFLDDSIDLPASEAHVDVAPGKMEELDVPNSCNHISSPVESEMQDTLRQESSTLEPVGEMDEGLVNESLMEEPVQLNQKSELEVPEMAASSLEAEAPKLTTQVVPQQSDAKEISQEIDWNLQSETETEIKNNEKEQPPSPKSDQEKAEEGTSKSEISEEAQVPALTDILQDESSTLEGSFEKEDSNNSEDHPEPETFNSSDGVKDNVECFSKLEETQMIDEETCEQEETVDVSAQKEEDMMDTNNLIGVQEVSEGLVDNSEDSCNESNDNPGAKVPESFIANPELTDAKSNKERELEPSNNEEDSFEVAEENQVLQEIDLIEEQELGLFVSQSCFNQSSQHERSDHEPFVDEFLDVSGQLMEIYLMDLERHTPEEHDVDNQPSIPENSENETGSVALLQESQNEGADVELSESTNFSTSQPETPEQEESQAEEISQKSEDLQTLESQSCICLPPNSPLEESSSVQEAETSEEIDKSDDKVLNNPDGIEEPELGMPNRFHHEIDLPMELFSIDDELDLEVNDGFEDIILSESKSDSREVEVDNQESSEDVMDPNQSGESVELLDLEVGDEIEAKVIESQSEPKSTFNQVEEIPKPPDSEPSDVASKEAEIEISEEDNSDTTEEDIDKTVPKLLEQQGHLEVPEIESDEAMVVDLDPPLEVSDTSQTEDSIQDQPEDSTNQQGDFQCPSPGTLMENQDDVSNVEPIATDQSEFEDVAEEEKMDSESGESSVAVLKPQDVELETVDENPMTTIELQEPEVAVEEDDEDEFSVISSKQEDETVGMKSPVDTSVNIPDEQKSQLVDADDTQIESLANEKCPSGDQIIDQVEVASVDLVGELEQVESSSPKNDSAALTVIENSDERSNRSENIEECHLENSKSGIIDEQLSVASGLLNAENSSLSSLNNLDNVEIPTNEPLKVVEDEENSDCLEIDNDRATSDPDDSQHVKSPEEPICNIEEDPPTPSLINADVNQKDNQITHDTKGLEGPLIEADVVATSEDIMDDEEKEQNTQSGPENVDFDKVTHDAILNSDELGDIKTNNEKFEASEDLEKMEEDDDEVQDEFPEVDPKSPREKSNRKSDAEEKQPEIYQILSEKVEAAVSTASELEPQQEESPTEVQSQMIITEDSGTIGSLNKAADEEKEQQRPEMCPVLDENSDSVSTSRGLEPVEKSLTEAQSQMIIQEDSENIGSLNEADNEENTQSKPGVCQVMDENSDYVPTATIQEAEDEPQSQVIITEDSESIDILRVDEDEEEERTESEMIQVLDEKVDSVSTASNPEPEEESLADAPSQVIISEESESIDIINVDEDEEEDKPESESVSTASNPEPEEESLADAPSQVMISEEFESIDIINVDEDEEEDQPESESVSTASSPEHEKERHPETPSQVINSDDSASIDILNVDEDEEEEQPKSYTSQVLDEKAGSVSTASSPDPKAPSQGFTSEDSESIDILKVDDDEEEEHPEPEISQFSGEKSDSDSTVSCPEPEEETLPEAQSQVINSEDSESIDILNVDEDDEEEKLPDPEVCQTLDEKADSDSTSEDRSLVIISEDSESMDNLNKTEVEEEKQQEPEVCQVLDVSTASNPEPQEASFAEAQSQIINPKDSERVFSQELPAAEDLLCESITKNLVQNLELESPEQTLEQDSQSPPGSVEVFLPDVSPVAEILEEESDREISYSKDLPAPDQLVITPAPVDPYEIPRPSYEYPSFNALNLLCEAIERSNSEQYADRHKIPDQVTATEESVTLNTIEVDEHFEDSENVTIEDGDSFDKRLDLLGKKKVISDEETSSLEAIYGDEEEVEIESLDELDERSVRGKSETPEPISYNICEPSGQDNSLQSSDSAEKDELRKERHQSSEGPPEEPKQSLPPCFDTISGLARRPKKIDFFGRGGNIRLSSVDSLRSRKREYPNFDQNPEPLIVSPSFSGGVTPTLIEKADHHNYPLKKRHRVLNSQSDDGESMESASDLSVMGQGTSDFLGHMNLSTGRTRKRQATSSSEDTTPTKRSKTPPELQNHPLHRYGREQRMSTLEMPYQVVAPPPPPEQSRPRNEPVPQSSGPFINLSEVFPRDEFDPTDDDLASLGKRGKIICGIFPLDQVMLACPMGATLSDGTTGPRSISANCTSRIKGWNTRRQRRK